MADADANAIVDTALGTPTPPDPSAGTPTPKEPEAQALEPKVEAKTEEPKPESKAEGPKPVDWRERRLGEVSEQKRALEDQLAAARKELEGLKSKAPEPEGQKSEAKYTEAEVLKRAAELAKTQAAEQRFTDKCNDVYAKGQEKFPDFQSTLASYAQLGGLQRPFVEAVLQAGDKAPEILHALGKDLNEASRVMSLPAIEQAFEIAKMAGALSAKPQVAPAQTSGAPAPVKPKVGGAARSEPDVYDDTLSTKDWIALRNKELSDRHARR